MNEWMNESIRNNDDDDDDDDDGEGVRFTILNLLLTSIIFFMSI